MFLDSHPDHTVSTPFDHLNGWASMAKDCSYIKAYCAGVQIPFSRLSRPDVAAFAPHPFFAFGIYLDLPLLSQTAPIRPGPFDIEFHGDGAKIATCTVQITETAIANNQAILENRQAKQAFIAKHTNRPLHSMSGSRAPSGLPPDWSLSPDLAQKTDAVSTHEYGGIIIDFLNELGADKFVLDAGAGLRKTPFHNVINMEIYDYPSTDILGIGQDLPFKDDTFDGVLSLAVLEHVDDPFRCARELIRVLKPGGKILVIVPFLQPEHGFPSHYFNATRFGMRKLFSEGAILEKHFLELSNHPIFTINHLLSLYAAGLPDAQRERFLDTPVRDLVASSPTSMHLMRHEFVTDLSEEMQWTLAYGTTAIFVKESNQTIPKVLPKGSHHRFWPPTSASILNRLLRRSVTRENC